MILRFSAKQINNNQLKLKIVSLWLRHRPCFPRTCRKLRLVNEPFSATNLIVGELNKVYCGAVSLVIIKLILRKIFNIIELVLVAKSCSS